MNWRMIVDAIFPYIEALNDDEVEKEKNNLETDIAAINSAKFRQNEDQALNEARRVAASESDRVKTAESKATTYLAVLAAVVPLIITLQSTFWENKSGPAPYGLKFAVLMGAIVYVTAAGYHSFKTLQVSGFQRVGEAEIAAAWRLKRPLLRLIRSTLLATRRSRKVVNSKVTRIRVTHHHLIRAFVAFILLLVLDPLFYALGYRSELSRDVEDRRTTVIETTVHSKVRSERHTLPDTKLVGESGSEPKAPAKNESSQSVMEIVNGK